MINLTKENIEEIKVANKPSGFTNVEIEKMQVCKSCGKKLPISKFMKYGNTYKKTCRDCITSKFRKTRNNSNNNNSTDKFKDFTSRELIAELRHRGYKGNITFTITKEIVL